jgi:hypothetical protein
MGNRDAIPLSPVDHVFTGRGAYPLEFVFAYGGQEGLAGLERLHVVHPRAGLLVTNLSRLPCGRSSSTPGRRWPSTSSPRPGAARSSSPPRTAWT